MSKRYKHPPINFQDFKDKIEREGAIPVEMPNGKTFYIRPPELLPDDIYEKITSGRETDAEVAKAMLDDFDGFIESGGTLMLLSALVAHAREANEATQGASVGESEASSSS